MPALLRIGMFVKRRSIEVSEPMWVVWKVAGDPVQDDAQSSAVAGIDERGEIRGTAEPAGWSVHSGRLIAPGPIEGMLADRQKLQVRKAEVARISGQRL